MAESALNWKHLRTELRRHLHSYHGGSVRESTLFQGFTVEELEKFHQTLHFDGYACPPHSHAEVEPGTYELGAVQLTLGEAYLDEVRESIKGAL